MAALDAKPHITMLRLLPLLGLAALFAYGISEGWYEYYQPRAIADRVHELQMYVQHHLKVAILAFAITYIVAVALSIPGASLLTLLIGFLFGWMIAAPLVIVSATIGAIALFLVAKTAFGDILRARAGPALDRLAKGFEQDAFNYLLFLRLVPLFPFWLVNIAPAFLGVRLSTYAITTFIGIIPGTFAYSYAGGSLDSVFASARADEGFMACMVEEETGLREAGSCALPIDLGDLITTEIVIALVLLGILALIPVALRRLHLARRFTGEDE